MQKNILIVVNGFGLGNSTRCSAVIIELVARGYSIDLLTSGNGMKFFSDSSEISNIFQLEALSYASSKGRISLSKTFFSLPKLLLSYFKNICVLRALLKKNSYQAVIIDSDYSVLGALSKLRRTPVIAINNAIIVVDECQKKNFLPPSVRTQYWIEKMDYWFHKLVPDLVICPTLKKCSPLYSKFKYVGPITRKNLLTNAHRTKLSRVVVMLSGSHFSSSLKFLKDLPKMESVEISVLGQMNDPIENIKFLGKNFDNCEILNGADVLVINAGFSSISEAVVLRKPMVVIPIENHAEQFINADFVKTRGIGLVADQGNAHQMIVRIVNEYANFSDSFEKLDIELGGAQKASQIIDEYVRANLLQAC